MKYIDSEKITAKIDGIIDGLKRNCTPDPMGTIEECLIAAEIEALELVKSTIDEMKQKEPTPPGIEEESHNEVKEIIAEEGKRGEKLAETEEDKLESRTDGSDAFDTLCFGVEKFHVQTFKEITEQEILMLIDWYLDRKTDEGEHGLKFDSYTREGYEIVFEFKRKEKK